jgi:hypothetical protein
MIHLKPITNPHTDGRGPAVELRPHEESSISVRYDEYDTTPFFAVTMRSRTTVVRDVIESDDGVSLLLSCIDGEVLVTLPGTLFGLLNEIDSVMRDKE